MMSDKTLSVIAICHGAAFTNFKSITDNIKEWVYAKKGFFKNFSDNYINYLIVDTLIDYLNHCNRPGDVIYNIQRKMSNKKINIYEAIAEVLRSEKIKKNQVFINGFSERYMTMVDNLFDLYESYNNSLEMEKYYKYISKKNINEVLNEKTFSSETAEIIAICKGHGFKRFDNMADNIHDYLNAKYYPNNIDRSTGKTIYNYDYIEALLRKVLYEYLDYCDKPSHVLRMIDNNIALGFSWVSSVISVMAAETVIDETGYKNGFTENFNNIIKKVNIQATNWYKKGVFQNGIHERTNNQYT